MTPTTIGWVMAEGRDNSFPTVSGDEFVITRGDAGSDAVSMASSASAVAGRVRTVLAERGERLHGVGVTWSDEAAVGAALLLESLADAGFDNVVPVRFSRAAASLTSGIETGGGQTAVCVIEPGWATLVAFDGSTDANPIVTGAPIDGADDVIGWLAEAFGSGGRRPEVLMVAGSMRGMDRLGRRLESTLSVPVFVQAGAQQALARGAALSLGPHADLSGPPAAGIAAGREVGAIGSDRSMSLSYAGALMMLVGGAVAFVASVSAALSLQLGPSRDVPEVRPAEHVTVARVAVPGAPPPAAPVVPPPAAPAPVAEMPEGPAEIGSLWDGPVMDPGPPPSGGPSLLDRVRNRIPRLPGR